MLFHEVYSKYYYAIAQILAKTNKEPLNKTDIDKIIQANTFEKSFSYPFFKYETKKDNPEKAGAKKTPSNIWNTLLKKTEDGKYKSILEHIPEKPLTTLEKQWLKSILSDPKMKLFFSDTREPENLSALLSDIEPLYSNDTFVYFDQHINPDPFDDPKYQEFFRTIIKAKEENQKLNIQFRDYRKKKHNWICVVKNLEYSEKDNKFRVIVIKNNEIRTINLARITSCAITGETLSADELSFKKPVKEQITLHLEDKNKALDRVMLSFSDLEKETENIVNNTYKVKLYYYKEDEKEIIIRILAFGNNLKVIGDEEKVRLIKNKIEKQKKLFETNPDKAFILLKK